MDDMGLTRLKRIYASCTSLAANVMSLHDSLQNVSDACGAFYEGLDMDDPIDDDSAPQAMQKMQEMIMRVDTLVLAVARSFQDGVIESFSLLPHGIPEAIGASAKIADGAGEFEDKTDIQSVNCQMVRNFQTIHRSLEFVLFLSLHIFPTLLFICIYIIENCSAMA